MCNRLQRCNTRPPRRLCNALATCLAQPAEGLVGQDPSGTRKRGLAWRHVPHVYNYREGVGVERAQTCDLLGGGCPPAPQLWPPSSPQGWVQALGCCPCPHYGGGSAAGEVSQSNEPHGPVPCKHHCRCRVPSAWGAARLVPGPAHGTRAGLREMGLGQEAQASPAPGCVHEQHQRGTGGRGLPEA